LGKNPAQMEYRRGVTECVRAPVCSLGAYKVTVPCEQLAQLDCGSGITALVTAAIGRCGARRILHSLEQYAEARGGGCGASPLGATVSNGGGLEVPLSGE
jgi:hypothetical protein